MRRSIALRKTIATYPRMIAAVALVLAASLLVLVGPLTNKAQAQTEPPPRLFGEELVTHDNGILPGDPVGSLNIFDRACDSTGGTGTFNFTASGDAYGPYPGTFTETGTVEVGPYDFLNGGNTILSLTSNFEINYEIDSQMGHITGTKRFVPGSSTGFGNCHPMNTVASTDNVQVEATIETPDGRTCTTTGKADLNVSESAGPMFAIIKDLREKFDVGFETPTCDGSEEPTPQISIADATIDEGDTGTSEATFNVTLSEASTNAVTVDYTTEDGTATQPHDYDQTQGTLTFEANQTTATISVPVRGDTADEPDESFSVILSNPQNAEIADGEGSATIVDDDEDGDGDGVADDTDNCPSVPNPEQVDTDGDRVGDACDEDIDNDTVLNGTDNCPDAENPEQTNTDGDAQGDPCDADDDGDGVADSADNCSAEANADQVDADGDGIGNACDGDVDGDSVNNELDNCPSVANPEQGDTDSDGVGDACDLLSYTFSGFLSPVDDLPTLNEVKAGQAIPVKFSLGGDKGLDIFADGYPKSQAIDCSTTAPVDPIEQTVSAGSSSLSYETTTDQYTYVWKTNKDWTGCRQLVVRFDDDQEHKANFQFVR